ncbi:MAG: biotin/lipoyl-binding protein [Lachnospiraceae bacterium]|nr:biotin/lipoyl-binding protein [Lachnospiraceae bacterium]
MKSYTITVNGTAYEVTVEENGAGAATTAATTSAPKAAPKKATPKASGKQGSVKINSPMPGKILSIKLNAGATVKKGDVIMLLEAMKMENEIVASEDGVIASINVAVGNEVEAGEVLATLE